MGRIMMFKSGEELGHIFTKEDSLTHILAIESLYQNLKTEEDKFMNPIKELEKKQ
jgi:hypothetical protein